MNTRQLLLAWFFACLLPLAAQADVWQDPETKVNYGYEPGSGVAQVLRSGDVEGEVFILPRITIDGMEYVVKTNERYAFSGNGALRSISIPGTIGYVQFYTFQDCSSLSSAQLGEGTYGIGDYCFYRTQSLKSIVLPSSLSNISYHAFSESALDSITIPDGITWFGRYNFKNCRNLKKVVLPAVSTFQTDWGGHGYCRNFENCTALEEVVCRSSVPPIILENPFAGVDLNKVMLYVPKGTKEQYLLASIWNEFKDIVEMDIDTGPKLLNTTPRNEDTNIPTSGTILLTFDETVKLREKTIGKLNDIELVPIVSDNTIVFEYSGLDWKKKYTFILPHDCIMDLAGNIVVKDINLSFTTTDHPANAILPYGQFSKRPWFAKNTKNPTEDWYQYGLNDSEWETIVGPINNGSVEYWNTKFPLHAKLYLRRHFHLTEIDTTKNYMLLMGHDLDCKAWVNGTMVLDEKFAHYGWDYSTVLLDKSILKQGDNVLAVYVRDDNPPAFIDCGLYTDAEVAAEEKGELFIDLSPKRIEENANLPVKLKITRTGSWAQEETFLLTATADSRVTVPTTITIPARQSAAVINLPIKNNDVLDADSIVEITAMGESYETVKAQLVIEDDDYPALTVKSSKSTVSEGETFQLTISTSEAVREPLTVTLTCENPRRFTCPMQATIPAGQKSMTVDVTAKDDDVPSETLSNAFIVSAPRYENGEVIVLLEDDDMPVLELTILPNKVQEGAGPVSVAGILRRTGVTSNKITVRLSDDSNGGLYFGTRELVLNKGVEEVSFNFGPIDNAQVDGDRTYTITAAVWLSSCSCSAAGESAGSVSAQLEVFDDDGPALTLASTMSTIKEGGKTMLTVGRNTLVSIDQPLTVHLSSDYDDNLSYDHTVTIPAGQQSVQVEIASKKNDVSGDTHTVVFTVQADGFASATCYLMVTDQTLPDAVITSISVAESDVEAGGECIVTVTVANWGFATLPGQTPINLYLKEGNTLVGRMYTQDEVSPGETISVSKGIHFYSTVGYHSLYAIVNESHVLQELQYTNNTSYITTVHLLPSFSAIVEVENAVYLPKKNVNISGMVSGKSITNAEVEVYLLNSGLRQIINTTTDERGHFSISWKPMEKEVGHFIVGVCAPGEESRDSLTSFDVIGLQVAKKYSAIEVDAGAVVSDSFTVFNPCSLPLTSIRFETLDSSNLSITSQTIDRLEPGQSAHLRYSITGNEPTIGNDWQSVPINIICQEGGRTNHQLYCYVHTPKARLETNTLEIQTTMVKGRVREYPIIIKNTGRGASGRIHVDTGNATWLSSSTASNIPSLEFGDSATVVLQFTATDDMLANNTMEGYIAINCENGVGCLVRLTVETVSEEMGSLTIDVWDEYTYFTEEAPHVAGANVRIMHPVTGQLLASSTTNAIGTCTFTLPEGIYNISVDKENHESFLGNVVIDPGRDKSMIITILLETIQVSLAFEETEVEDVYHITTTVEYETNVPTPVVVLNLPDTIPVSSMSCGESILIEAIVTNKGLIKAIDTYLEFPEIPGLKFTILENELFDLPAQQSILVPILVTRYCLESENHNSNNDNNGGGIGGIINFDYSGALLSNIPCYIPVYVYYGVNCNERKYKKGYSKYLGLKPCPPIEISEVEHEVLPPPCGDGSGGGGSGETVIRSGNLPIVMPDCDYRYNNAHVYLGMFIECLVKGIYRNLPVFGPGINVALCADEIEQCVRKKAQHTPECMQTVIECLHIKPGGKAMEFYEKGKQVASPITSFFDCQQYLQQFKDSMEAVPPGTPLTARSEVEQHNVLPDFIIVYQERINQIATALQGEMDYMKEFFGNDAFLQSEAEEVLVLLNYLQALPENTVIDKNAILPYKPDNISEASFFLFIDRLNNTCRIDNGEAINTDNYISETRVIAAMDKIASARTYATTHGFTSLEEMFSLTVIDAEERYESQRENICAKITLQLEQTMTLTRPAIRGTLNVKNGHDSSQMTDIILKIIIKDEDGKIATEREFQIIVENLNGFLGSLDLTSGWTLASQQTGTAKVLLIPSKYAAPLEPKNYLFGGTLSYVDPFTGLRVTREFIPQKLTVNPSPDLELTYLMQRDVYGDDPLTTDKVEPMEEAEFALIINNKGYGEAKNVRMLTEQPKITENEKGLFIDFDIISSQVNGNPATLSLGQTIANDFGSIAARSQSYAQWWLRSTLLGHFTSYEVEANHVTSYGNQDLSLVDTVTIHEMVHGFTPKSNMKRGWLVNDIADADDMPDVVYFTDATQQSLYMATATTGRKSDTEYQLTMTSKTAGWNYGSVADPTNGKQKLVKIVRQSDGVEMPVDNVWQTDRTLRDGRDWLYENRLHFVGEMANGSETYILTFEPKPDVELAVEQFIGVPPEETVLTEPLNEMTVRFTKAIQPETFTADDITLHCQGERQDEKTIIITKQSNTDYLLRLDQVNQQDGYYVLTVQTAGITDSEGFNGRDGKSVSWVQYLKTEMPETYFYVTTTPAGYATFYDSQIAYKLPADLKANVVSGASSEKLTYTVLNGDVVPKGVPVMLESNPHKADTYKLTSTESAAAYNGTNLLRGSDIPTMATPDSGEQIYKLAYGPSETKWSKVFGWYWGAENGGAFQIEGHKAWLAVPVTSGSRMTGYFVDGDALDVEAVMQNQNGHTDIYDLQGRKIENRQLPKGVYIWNRQKVIVK